RGHRSVRDARGRHRQMMSARRVRLVALTCLVVAFAAPGCRRWAGRNLLAAPLPDLSRVDAGVQAQVRGRYEALTRALSDRADAPELASAFGQYGMVLQAAEFYDV